MVESDYRQTPLHWAVLRGHHNMVRVLVHAGASLEEEDSAGCTPVHYGAQYGQILCTQILLAEGANSQPIDSKGRSPLMWACHLNQPTMARYLIARGNSLNLQDTDDTRAAIHWAARSGHRLPCMALIRCGADLSITDKAGRTAADLALSENHPELAAELNSYQSKKHRLQYLWDSRIDPENRATAAFIGSIIWSLIVFYFNVFYHTPYRTLLLIQMTLTVVGGYLGWKLSQQKEAGAITEPELPISANPAAQSNDNFFHNLSVEPTAKMAWPFRAAYSEKTGNFVRHFSHFCSVTHTDICGENYRQFMLWLAVVAVDALLMLLLACDVVSANPGSPSIFKIHMWVWYNMWHWRYALLVAYCLWWIGWMFTHLAQIQPFLAMPFMNIYAYEVQNLWRLRYLQDGIGNFHNPWQYLTPIDSIRAFLVGKLTPDHDMYSYSELKTGPWRHPSDKRSY